MLKRASAAFALAATLISTTTPAQVQPSGGNFTLGHGVRVMNSAGTAIGDAGGAAGTTSGQTNYLTELGITNTGTPLCINDAFTNAVGGYHQMCFGAKALGGGLISYNAYNGASALGLFFNINGTTYGFPGPGNGNVMGPVSSIDGDMAVFNGTSGTIIKDGGPPATFVGTTAALQALAVAGRGGGYSVLRGGYYVVGDASTVLYSLSTSPCSLNAGAGDGGSQVASTTAGYCWILGSVTAYSVKQWGATGSSASTTGNITASSGALTIGSASDFQNKQQIDIFGAGATFTGAQATSVGIATGGTTGSTAWCVRIVTVDSHLAYSAATSEVCDSNGIAMPNTTNAPDPRQVVTYTDGSTTGGSNLIYIGQTGAEICAGSQSHNSPFLGTWTYYGLTQATCPSWAPTSPPAQAGKGVLVTTITAGGGTTSLTVSPTATNTASGAVVKHDDTAAIQEALASVQNTVLPAGNYHITSGLTLNQSAGQSLSGCGSQCALLVPDGIYDVVSLLQTTVPATSFSQEVSDFGITASGMAGGYCMTINGANRPYVRNIQPNSCYNDMQITDSFIGTIFRYWAINQRRGDYGWYLWGTGSGVAAQAGVYDIFDVNTSSFYQGVGIRINGNVASLRTYKFGIESGPTCMVADNAIGAGTLPTYADMYSMGFNACFLHAISLTATQNYVFYKAYVQQSGPASEAVYIDQTASQTKFDSSTITTATGGNGITNGGFATEIANTDIVSGLASAAGIECTSTAVDMTINGGTTHNVVGLVQSTTLNYGLLLDSGCANWHADGVFRGKLEDTANRANNTEGVLNGVSYPVPNSHVNAAGGQSLTVASFPNLYLGTTGNQAFFDTTGYASTPTYTTDTAANILGAFASPYVGQQFTIIWRNHSNNTVTVAGGSGVTMSGTTIPASGGTGMESQTRLVGTITNTGSPALTLKVCANLAGAC